MERQSIREESARPRKSSAKVNLAQVKMSTDHSASKKRLNRIKGQLDAVSRMIDEKKYCPDIIQQIRAATSALRGLEAEVLRGHLRGCVKKAFESENAFDMHDKIEEILLLLK